MIAGQQHTDDSRSGSGSRANRGSAAVVRSRTHRGANGGRTDNRACLHAGRGRGPLAGNQLGAELHLCAIGQGQAGQLQAQPRTVRAMRFLSLGNATVNGAETLRHYHPIHYDGL
jgi:hypothetical protein